MDRDLAIEAETMIKVSKRVIAREYRDSDGYWIELKRGYRSANDPMGYEHQIHENTKRDAYAVGVLVCGCSYCRGLEG